MDFKGLAEAIKRIKEETTLVTTCPIDGFPLEASSRNNNMWCPFCGYPFDKLKRGDS